VTPRKAGLPRWLPYPVGALTVTLAVVLWQVLVVQQAARIRQTVAIETNSLRTELQSILESRIEALLGMGVRWEAVGGTSRASWEAGADLYLEHMPDYVTIAWADSTLEPRWSAHREETTDTTGVAEALGLAFGPLSGRVLDPAPRRGEPVVASGSLEPGREGASALVIYVPLFPGGAFDGVLAGVLQLSREAEVLEGGMGERRYSFRVFDDEHQLFGRFEDPDEDQATEAKWGQEMRLSLPYGLSWSIRAWPDRKLLAQERTHSPEIIFAVTLILALVLPRTVAYAQETHRRARRAENLTRLLKEDIARRRKTEKSLGRTQIGVDCATDPIYWVREDGRILYANEAASNSSGYSLQELLEMSVPEIDPDYPSEAWPAHWTQMKEAGSLTFDGHHRAKDGRVFPVEITTNFVVDGSEEFVWAYVRDITERLKAEAERQRVTDELIRTNAELKHFNDLAVGRELRMIDLKREVNELLEKTGQPPAYDVSFAPDAMEET